MLRELRIVIAAQTHRRLRQVIGAETEELSFFSHKLRSHRGAPNLDHPADHILQVRHASLGQHRGRDIHRDLEPISGIMPPD